EIKASTSCIGILSASCIGVLLNEHNSSMRTDISNKLPSMALFTVPWRSLPGYQIHIQSIETRFCIDRDLDEVVVGSIPARVKQKVREVGLTRCRRQSGSYLC